MRVFIALLFSLEEKKLIFDYKERLSKNYEGNYTTFDNLHLTLYYVGEVKDSELKLIKDEIKKINLESFVYEVSGIGSFKNKGDHCLVHLEVGLNYNLLKLQSRVLNALKKAFVPITQTNFTPHITIGRKVKMSIEDIKKIRMEKFSVVAKKISIMESKRVNENLVYEEIDFQSLK